MSDEGTMNEVLIKKSGIKEIDLNLHEVLKSICKIIYKKSVGTGFLIKLYKEEKELYCLMTNEHVVTKDMIETNEVIDVIYCYEKEWIKIKLDMTQRFIKYDLEMDITIIEIIPADKIGKIYFLLPNINEINYINEDIYIVQFPEGKNLSYSEGKIKEINNLEFTYDASTKPGSSGSPILLKNTTKVIGIHKKGNQHKKRNYGTLINSFIQSLEFKIEIIENDSTEVYENGNYYVGQSLNGKKHGKGIIFNKDGNIIYDGDFVNDKKEGIGKRIYKDGYYIGPWLKDKRQGKGIIFYKDGSIKYEGDFAKDKIEGNGKYVFENGNYYIGQFLNNRLHGKGTLYYNNGNVCYEGDYVNGLREGNGKLNYPNGDCYEGQFLNNKKHGKGIIRYYNNPKKVLYEGEFFNDQKEGFGKFIAINGNYYIGQWKKGKMHGKGKLCYANNSIKYEGDLVEDHEEGIGRYNFPDGGYYYGQWLKGKKHGKGKEYYKNGRLKYDGDYVNDKPEGDGKFIDENGNYYIGQFLNGKRKGKGIICDKNGNIISDKNFDEKELDKKDCAIF